MKKIYYIIILLLLSEVIGISRVNAGYDNLINRTQGAANLGYIGANGNNLYSLPVIIGSVVGLLLGGLGVSFFMLIIYGGYIWFISRGNEDQVDQAKSIIIDATIGLIVVLVAYILTFFVTSSIVPIGLK